MTDAPPGEPSADPRDALIREQAQLIAAQAQKIAALEATVAGLGEQLEAAARAGSRNSGNSSMPPSSDDLPGRKPPRKQRALLSGGEEQAREAAGQPDSALSIGPRLRALAVYLVVTLTKSAPPITMREWAECLPALIAGFLGQTGLTLEPEPP